MRGSWVRVPLSSTSSGHQQRDAEARSACFGGGLVLPVDLGDVGPEAFELVVVPLLLVEDVDDEVAVVEEHPAQAVQALMRAGGALPASNTRPSPSASQGSSGGIGVQGACEEISATSAKTGGRGPAASRRRSRAARVNWSGIVTQLNGRPR